jgi:hypothetical protein
VTDEEYLTDRGWLRQVAFETQYRDWLTFAQWSVVDALTIQRARDAAEERRCVSDAIANAAARHSKSAAGVTEEQKRAGVAAAADLARDEWRRRFGGDGGGR